MPRRRRVPYGWDKIEPHPFEQMVDGSFECGVYWLNQIAEPGETFTLDAIGHVCGCSYEWVRLVERRALRKLRKEFEKRGLKGLEL